MSRFDSVFLLGLQRPERGAPRAQTLRFVRDLNLRVTLLCIPGWAVVLLVVGHSFWVYVAIAQLTVGALDVAYLTRKLARLTQ